MRRAEPLGGGVARGDGGERQGSQVEEMMELHAETDDQGEGEFPDNKTLLCDKQVTTLVGHSVGEGDKQVTTLVGHSVGESDKQITTLVGHSVGEGDKQVTTFVGERVQGVGGGGREDVRDCSLIEKCSTAETRFLRGFCRNLAFWQPQGSFLRFI